MRDVITAVIVNNLSSLQDEYGVEITVDMIELPAPPNPEMGDYALNLPMRLAKSARKAPIIIAQRIAELLTEVPEWFSLISVAPPGYVNITLSTQIISRSINKIFADPSLGLHIARDPQTVVVDYSGVNIAKQMHVGHLRSTIIGDTIARILTARGENVIRQNHLGDWGLPIAMVLWKTQPILRQIEAAGGDVATELNLARLEEIYRDASTVSKSDILASETIHDILVKLQNGDEQLLTDWRTITYLSMSEVYRVYQMMEVSLLPDDERGESYYRDMLSDTVSAISAAGKLTESQGAQCVFLAQFLGKDGQPLPVIVQKSDGGYNYETFDLAAIRFRINDLHADRIIYITDARQALHFQQIFAVADQCGWNSRDDVKVVFDHVTFGSVLGEDNKPLKTRSGESVKLVDLLNEAVERAYQMVNEKNPALAEEQKQKVAKWVGIGAVKYADLAVDRNRDYQFSWDRMLAFTGNTAPYLQYAHARICSIFRKGGITVDDIQGPLKIGHPAERALIMKLLEFAEVVAAVEAELRPHALCSYLYDLASAYSSFYDNCSVLNAETVELKNSRLFICRITQLTLAKGLELLGIIAPDEM